MEHDIRRWIRLIEYETRATNLVYHGSKTPAIRKFEKRTGSRGAWFDVKETASHGFFFALTADDAATFGPYVSSYRIRTNKPLIFGVDGVDAIADPKRRADVRYVFAGLLKRLPDGDYEHQGMTRDVIVPGDQLTNNDLDHYDDWIGEFLRPGGVDWEVLDNATCVARMRERGYDSCVVSEPSVKSRLAWFVLDATQIEFVADLSAAAED